VYKTVLSLIIMLIFLRPALGQEVEVDGHFIEDSVKVGMRTAYSLTVRHQRTTDILLPDSSYNFTPFEYDGKQWFKTKTTNDTSLDSVVYYLKTFEVDSVQHLELAFYKTFLGDSILIKTAPDSIALLHTVTSLPDSITQVFLRETTDYYRIKKHFNYPYFITGGLFLLMIGLALWLLFGKKTQRWFYLRKLEKEYARFINQYDQLTANISDEQLAPPAEKALIHWKRYMEKLENLPYSKMTTREIKESKDNNTLVKALREIDQVIYSGSAPGDVQQDFRHLRDISEDSYRQKTDKIKHGVSH